MEIYLVLFETIYGDGYETKNRNYYNIVSSNKLTAFTNYKKAEIYRKQCEEENAQYLRYMDGKIERYIDTNVKIIKRKLNRYGERKKSKKSINYKTKTDIYIVSMPKLYGGDKLGVFLNLERAYKYFSKLSEREDIRQKYGHRFREPRIIRCNLYLDEKFLAYI